MQNLHNICIKNQFKFMNSLKSKASENRESTKGTNISIFSLLSHPWASLLATPKWPMIRPSMVTKLLLLQNLCLMRMLIMSEKKVVATHMSPYLMTKFRVLRACVKIY